MRQLSAVQALQDHPAEEVIGIDEVGYGSWAGPLVVGGVVLPKLWDHELCRDSKSLSAKKREQSLYVLRQNWLAAVVMGMEAADVDQIGVHGALQHLTREVGTVLGGMYPNALLVQDGEVPVPIPHRDNTNMLWTSNADGLVPAVSAASILAKVTRDEDMVIYSHDFPEYKFESNKGYHSNAHKRALETVGPCPIHRFSYKPLRPYVVGSQPWQSPRRKSGIDVWISFPAQ